MWNELASYRHNFLQLKMPYLKAERIDDLTRKDYRLINDERNMCKCPNDIECLHSTYFDDRSKLAYGWFALPKLMREMCSDTPLVGWQALNSLSEFLLNPLNAQRAINEMDIVRRLQNIFLRKRYKYRKEEYEETRVILKICSLLTNYLNGAEKMAARPHFLNEFYKIMYEGDKYQQVTAKILRNMSEKSKVLLFLLEKTNALEWLTKIFYKDPCQPHYEYDLWIHLGHFLEVAAEQAIEQGFFELLYRRIERKLPGYHLLCLKCFALLLQCTEGQRRFDDCDGVVLMHRLLAEDGLMNTREYAVLAFQNAIVSKRTLWRCCQFMDIAKILTRHAGCQKNQNLQLYALQAIRQMGQMPCIKRYIREVCLRRIRNIHCVNKENECMRDDLVRWLERKIYNTD